MKYIEVINSRENNLKNVSVSIPKNSFCVISGVSGSGKSSLAFDTIFAEGQRRYMESLSSYARQFLGNMKKPDVDDIKGLSPAISINQKTTSSNPRSTVGTITEIHDYLRLLYSSVGAPYYNNERLEKLSIDTLVRSLMEYPKDTKLTVLSPIVMQKKGAFKKELDEIKKDGFLKIRVDKEFFSLEDDDIQINPHKNHDIDVLISRIKIDPDRTQKIIADIELASSMSSGKLILLIDDEEKFYSTSYYVKETNTYFPDISSQLFSFNSQTGACENCSGLGYVISVDEKSIFDFDLSINDGGILVPKSIIGTNTINALSKHYKFDLDEKLKNLDEKIIDLLLNGSGHEKIDFVFEGENGYFKVSKPYSGIVKDILDKYNTTSADYLSENTRKSISQFMRHSTCKSCNGDRLNKFATMIKIGGLNIVELSRLSIADALEFISKLQLSDYETKVALQILDEVKKRLTFLFDVGLGYINLFRSAGTLSGGEAQRIRLASQIGSGLSGVLYVLDEPSIGLHQRDNDRLIKSLKNLQNQGNTLVIVEHDKDVMLSADYIIELGMGSGIHGGNVVYQGSVENLIGNANSVSGEYLAHQAKLKTTQRNGNGECITISNAQEHNLKNIDVKIPLGRFVCITGVSGSGKSTLINDILYPKMYNHIYKSNLDVGKVGSISGKKHIDKVINVDQSPIGKTPSSNPATYIGVFDMIRKLFSELPESKAKGYKPGRFSFNVSGGRCEKCDGDGVKKIEMQFLPDVYVECDVCHGKRYNKQTLDIYYKNKNIYDILDMRVEEAVEFFANHPQIHKKIKTLLDVGLDYIKLGQSASSLSGGEAQRVKLANEISKRATGNTLYILDEPSTGLHFRDIQKLLDILNLIADMGNTVVVIEHNLDIILESDYVIDLGPEGGDLGGDVVFEGETKDIIKCEKSHTGQYLKRYLNM